MAIPVSDVRSHVITDPPEILDTDVAIVGSGMGGGSLAYALRESGLRVLIVEQGDSHKIRSAEHVPGSSTM
ncbi:NAD(P)-binding protein [Mycolicibacterium mucogenicum]|uniref:NAD(P)-binding protein n=1 Tax=Mycolicibacterium mucogenicum TaxID=56689 RepID=UPI0009F69DFD|nr:NAD(P)-binding protein [Mycolicibacterium mucogenicum]